MVKKRELQKLSNARLEAIKDLHNKGHYDIVVSESGLVLEFALKAAVCKCIRKPEYPESEKRYRVHDPEKLIDLAKIRTDLDYEKSNNLDFFVSWSLLSKWSINFRYMPIGTNNEKTSEKYIEALDGSKGGVHPWVKKHW